MPEYSLDQARDLIGGDRIPTGAIPAAWWITTDPDQLAAYDRWSADFDAHREQIEALAATIGRTADDAYFTVFGDRSVLTGFSVPREMTYWHEHPDHLPVPEGWRIDRKTDRLVPSRRTKADRESQANKDFAAVASIPNVRTYVSGLPNEVYIENRDMGGTVYGTQYRRGVACVMAFKGGDPDRTPERKRWDDTKVNTNVWHRQRISVLVALREDSERAKA
ncbi:uncharacterized protein RMCC_5742, partial [Mycolicibacterium canariasense]